MCKKKGLASLALMMVLLLVACTGKASPTPTLRTIRLPMGYIPNVQFAPIYVAVERGYFAEEGLALEFDYSFETDGVKLVGVGELPFAIASGDQVILARAQGLPVVYITEWYQRFPIAVVALTESGIRSPQDLEGRRVGIPETFGASFIGWRALVEATHLDETKVQLLTIGYTQKESLVEGRVDAAVVYVNNEPVLLQQEGYDLQVIPVADYADLPANGLITNEQTIAQEPDLVRAFVRAFLRGLQDTLDDPEAAFQISTRYVEGLADNADVQRAVLQATLDYWRAERLGYSERETWENGIQVMQAAGLLDVELNVDDLFNNDFLP
ncbi:MAG: ABC transporter substrate-binding protein [Chloroflexi bacterium]|nr:MAG: ABC transporter substrate-binding protein [Chloroflexota bacterium]